MCIRISIRIVSPWIPWYGTKLLWSSSTRFISHCFSSLHVASVQMILPSSIYMLILNIWTLSIVGPLFLTHCLTFQLRWGNPPFLGWIQKKIHKKYTLVLNKVRWRRILERCQAREVKKEGSSLWNCKLCS